MSIREWVGIEIDEVSIADKLIAGCGGLLGILFIAKVNQYVFGEIGAPMLIASMGASALLIFAIPHGPLSQPWPVVAGQVVSAIIGVTCAKFIPDVPISAACSVGLSIGAMHFLKCLHPPGGATALNAVIGGQAIHAMGYNFVWFPVLLDSVILVSFAVCYNGCFPWRRYPAVLGQSPTDMTKNSPISHTDVITALRSMNSFVDVSEADLIRLCQLITTNGGNVDMKRG